MAGFGLYSVTKAALNHYTRILAEELRMSNIQVNGLDPGVMDTRMQEEIREMGPKTLGRRRHEHFLEMKEKGSLKPPEEAAALAVFLASPASDEITGEIGSAEHFARFGYAKD